MVAMLPNNRELYLQCIIWYENSYQAFIPAVLALCAAAVLPTKKP